jgi:hypothetical protein
MIRKPFWRQLAHDSTFRKDDDSVAQLACFGNSMADIGGQWGRLTVAKSRGSNVERRYPSGKLLEALRRLIMPDMVFTAKRSAGWAFLATIFRATPTVSHHGHGCQPRPRQHFSCPFGTFL